MDEATPQRQTIAAPPATLEQLSQKYIEIYPQLSAAVFEAEPSLSFIDSERITRMAAPTGADKPLTLEAFEKRATKLVVKEAHRTAAFYNLIAEHGSLIKSAIRRTLFQSGYIEHSIEIEDVFQEVSLLLYQYTDALLKPGTAKLSTRIYELARLHVLGYHVEKGRNRLRIVEARMYERGGFCGPETLSRMELASMRAEMDDESGYGELTG
jgi:hypothetical protein